MIDPQLRQYLSQGYAKLGDITYQIALNMRKGKNHVASQRALYEQGIKMSVLLKLLYRHIDFDVNGFPILYRITEIQVNRFIKCLIQLGELNTYPIVPYIIPSTKPILVTQGAVGSTGPAGPAGLDANIIVEPLAGETQILVSSTVLSGVKHYRVALSIYTLPTLLAAISGTKLFENGSSNTISLTLTIRKGRDNVVTLVCSDSTVNAILQPLVNLATINGITQPTNIILSIPTQTVPITLNFTINDATNNVLASDATNFVYPFLYGAFDAQTINPYTSGSRRLAVKSPQSFVLNGTDTYFSIGYDNTFGDLTKIIDQNGFDVTSAWTKHIISVTSTGLAVNYTYNFNIYVTNLKTTISNATYTIFF